MTIFYKITVRLWTLILFSCSGNKTITSASNVVYQSENLTITQIAENALVHTSFLGTRDFGVVPSNGLIVRNNNEAIIFDTPTDDKSSEELIQWITVTLHLRINAVIPTHYHLDCLGGLKAFHEKGISSYAYYKTIELAKENNLVVPENSFRDSLVLKVGNEKAIAKFFGEGHTKDNIVGFFPVENVMFGGCLIKEMNAGKGNLEDANLNAWPITVEKIKSQYPRVKVVVPGHGKPGNDKLLDYTIELFKTR